MKTGYEGMEEHEEEKRVRRGLEERKIEAFVIRFRRFK